MAVQTGKISWFGGPNDRTAGPTTASGAPVTRPGIAVYNHSTLGGWWMMKLPNGKLAVVQQTDFGPAPWTGRIFDFTSSSLGPLGYSEGNFPTNGTASGVYLGKTGTDVARNILGAAASLGADVPNIAGWLQKAANIKPGQIATSGAGGNQIGGVDIGALNTSNTLSGSSNPVQDVGTGVGRIADLLTSTDFWIRLGEALAGILLLVLAFRALTGMEANPVKLAARVAKHV